MTVRFLTSEKGEKAAAISIEYWNKINQQLEIGEPDFWDDLPIHVKDEIQKPQNQYLAGETKSNEEGMENFKIYL